MMTFANGELALSLNAADHCERKSLNIFFQRQADTYLFILYCCILLRYFLSMPSEDESA